MYDPQMGNPGPRDPEIVDFLIKMFNKHLDGPMAEALNTDDDFLNELVDGINDIFEYEIMHDTLFHQSTRTKCDRHDG